MIILNEVRLANEILEKKELGEKPSSTLFLLAKYYRHILKQDTDEIYNSLIDFIKETGENFNIAVAEDMLENFAITSEKYTIKQIDNIGITQSEINFIKQTPNKYQRLVFTFLVYAKYHLAVSQGLNNWVREPLKEIFKTAGVKTVYAKDRFDYVKYMIDQGWLLPAKKITNLSLQVTYIDRTEKSVMFVDDFRELGNEWDNYLGKGKYIRCKECSRLIRKKSNNMKYCKECAPKVNLSNTNAKYVKVKNS